MAIPASQSFPDAKQQRIEFLVKQNAAIYLQHSSNELAREKLKRVIGTLEQDMESNSERLLKLSSSTEALHHKGTDLQSTQKTLEVSLCCIGVTHYLERELSSRFG